MDNKKQEQKLSSEYLDRLVKDGYVRVDGSKTYNGTPKATNNVFVHQGTVLGHVLGVNMDRPSTDLVGSEDAVYFVKVMPVVKVAPAKVSTEV